MSSTGSSSASLLASRGWRLRHSLWLLAPIFGLGLFSFVGFVYVGLRARTRPFVIALVVGCLASAAAWTVLETTETTAADGSSQVSDAGAAVFLAVWVGLIVYGLALNRRYLRWRASRTMTPWYLEPNPAASAPLAPPPDGASPAWAPPAAQVPPSLGEYYGGPGHRAPTYGTPAYAGPPQPMPPAPEYLSPPRPPEPAYAAPPPVPLVDVNAAAADVLAGTLGLDPALAARVVALRASRGGFRDLDDLAATAGLQPHEMVRLRGRVSFGTVQPPAGQWAPPPAQAPPWPQDPRGGRVLDY